MSRARAPWATGLALLVLAIGLSAGVARGDGPCSVVAQGGEDSGIGGTGLGGEDSGIGGTGLSGEDSGIGGTGVLGTITGFASVCVNGLEIHYASDVAVRSNGAPATAADLAVGHVAWIVAYERGERLVAQEVSRLSALTGPVQSVDAARRRITVSGEIVNIPALTPVFGRVGEPLRLDIGTTVDVSGLRLPDGHVVATRIDAAEPGLLRSTRVRLGALLADAPPLARLSVESYLGRVEGARLRLGGIEVDARGVEPPRGLAPGARVVVEGTMREGALRAERIFVRGPDRPAGAERPVPLPAPETVEPPEPPEPPPVPPVLDRPDALRPDTDELPTLPDRPPIIDRPVIPERPVRPESFDRPTAR